MSCGLAWREGVDVFDRGDVRVPLYARRDFDDAILESPRVRKAVKGHVRELSLREFDAGYGDFESCCRAVNMLCELWVESYSRWFGEAIVAVCQICGLLHAESSLAGALCFTVDVEFLDGSVNAPNLIAWCAVCAVKGGSSYDCCSVFDSREARNLITCVFKNFDRLDITRYNDGQLQAIMEGGDYYGQS